MTIFLWILLCVICFVAGYCTCGLLTANDIRRLESKLEYHLDEERRNE